MKKLILASLVLASFLRPGIVMAEDRVCTQVYGGGVVCGAHTPVNTGLADNFGPIGIGLTLASGTLFYLAKKLKKNQA
jgi:hypothetical protein